jgi:hypothetical protein
MTGSTDKTCGYINFNGPAIMIVNSFDGSPIPVGEDSGEGTVGSILTIETGSPCSWKRGGAPDIV